MNQTRSFLLIAWLAVALFLYWQWGKFNAPAPAAAPPAVAATADAPPAVPAVPAVPEAGVPPAPAADGSVPDAPAGPPAAPASLAPTADTVRVSTDVLDLRVDLRGGNLVAAELPTYPVSKTEDKGNVRLLGTGPDLYAVAQSGLVAAGGAAAPSHEASYRVEGGAREFRLADGADTLEVPLLWEDPASGLQVRKTLVLERGRFWIRERFEVSNRGSQPWRGFAYHQLQRVPPAPVSRGAGFTNPEAYSFVGAAWYSTAEKFEKFKFDAFAEEAGTRRTTSGGWISFLQHHFALAWIPDKDATQEFSLVPANANGAYLVRSVGAGAPIDVAPGARASRDAILWVGPKLQDQMAEVAPTLNLSIDYGLLTFIAQPMFDYVLSPLHDLTGNWGWAIILTVVIIKLLLYKLSATQYRSFAKLRAVQPRVEALKERYGDDKQKFQMAMMELYKKEKVNPAAGCLPILVTIPIFIALYWVLLESVELRQAPWIGWIQNLTAPDPYFILPAINLVTMWLTQKMTPSPGMDPLQKKLMTAMPLVFGVMMAFFPSGLVLYWCTNGLLGLLQQWVITKRHGEKPAAAVAK